jgi:hypothetical protein
MSSEEEDLVSGSYRSIFIGQPGNMKALQMAGKANAGGHLVQTRPEPTDPRAQRWIMNGKGNSVWKIQNYQSRQCLGTPRGVRVTASARLAIEQQPCDSARLEQQWVVKTVPSRTYAGAEEAAIKHQASGLCIAQPNGLQDDNLELILIDCSSGDTRQWFVFSSQRELMALR